MPSALQWLLARLTRLVQTATSSLEQSYPDGVAAWQQEIARQLARYHAAAMLAGAGMETLTKPQTVAVTKDLATQLKYLGKFGIEVQDAAQWEKSWNSRAEMYAQSIKAPFYRGLTRMYPLPAMPADGTSQCLTNCLCMWELDEQPGDGNVDAYWRVTAAESCQTCLERGRTWAPIKIRDGVLQI